MKTPTSIVIAVAVLGAIATRAPVHAQPASEPLAVDERADPLSINDDGKAWNRGVPVALRREARTLFLEGNRLFWIPLFARAAEQYSAALRKWKHPAFYFNLALAELNLGHQVEAREHFAQAIQHGVEPLGTERFQEAQKQREDLERQLGQIAISCETPGAEVTLDGTLLFTGPGRYEGWVQARPHEITAKKPDHLSEARRVVVIAGARATLDLRLTTLSEAADRSRRWKTWKPWAVVASGAAIAAASGVMHAISARTFRSYDDEFAAQPCAQADGCLEQDLPRSLRDQLDRAELEQKIAIGGYIAGGAVIAAGAVLLYLNRSHLSERDTAQSSAIAVVPTLSPSTLGILVTVTH